MRLSFHGGAETVTGSKILLETGSATVLIDCGLFQGLKPLRLMNWERPGFEPREVDAVLLTHAHLDHSGYLPRLAREGFRGPVFCSPATADLVPILLRDAAKIQEEDADFANRKGFSKHHPALPLFNQRDAERAIRLLAPQAVGKPFYVKQLEARLHRAGHILGSTFVEVTVRDGGQQTHLVFSGDMGRPDAPLHQDPEPLCACDTLVLESTYGDREHIHEPLADQLLDAIEPTLRRGGIVLIPAFAVARAQLVTLLLNQLISSRRLAHVPVDVDSPMAVDATEIYRRYTGGHELDRMESGGILPKGARLHRTVAESKALSAAGGPRIIVSASGMLTGGRVLHHLKRLAGQRENLIVLIGYQAAGTRGRDLAEGRRTLRVHGEQITVNCQVTQLEGFSAHADASELVDWALSGPTPPRTVFLSHGEQPALDTLAIRLRARGLDTVVPKLGQAFTWHAPTRSWAPEDGA